MLLTELQQDLDDNNILDCTRNNPATNQNETSDQINKRIAA